MLLVISQVAATTCGFFINAALADAKPVQECPCGNRCADDDQRDEHLAGQPRKDFGRTNARRDPCNGPIEARRHGQDYARLEAHPPLGRAE